MIETDRETDKQAHTARQTDGQGQRRKWTDRQAHREKREVDRQTCRQTGCNTVKWKFVSYS